MTDYRKLPLGPRGEGRIGDIVDCPICHEHAVEVEDYTNPVSGSREKEIVYIHFDVPFPMGPTKEHEVGVNACRIRPKQLSRPATPEGVPRE